MELKTYKIWIGILEKQEFLQATFKIGTMLIQTCQAKQQYQNSVRSKFISITSKLQSNK